MKNRMDDTKTGKYILDPAELPKMDTIAGIEEIHRHVPQRFEFEMLSGIVLADEENQVCAGFHDVPEHPYWKKGHIPGRPLMPGVLMVEAAAQLCTYFYMSTHDDDRFLGFGGINDVKFRGTVLPGQRLYLVVKTVSLKSRKMIFNTQGFVDGKLVYQGTIIGMPV